VIYVSYAILLLKNILDTYIVMSSIFQNGTRSKTAYGCGFHLLGLLWAHQFLFLISGDYQVTLGGQNGGGRI
jgi:hypothetical protein